MSIGTNIEETDIVKLAESMEWDGAWCPIRSIWPTRWRHRAPIAYSSSGQ